MAMPELPEVETVRRGLARFFGRDRPRIASVRRSPLPLRAVRWRTVPLARLAGARLVGVDRHGKVLLLRLDGPATLALHLGMSGRLLADRGEAPRRPHTHLVLRFDDGRRLRLCDPRRFGSASALAGHPSGADLGLGPDALDHPWTAEAFVQAFAGTRRTVFDALLDQRRIAGLGNIYVQELLFEARIDPRAAAGRLARRSTARLAARVRPLLEAAIRRGGTTLRDFLDPSGHAGTNANALKVYGQAGAPCKICGTTLRPLRLGGRTVTSCSRCQRTGRSHTTRATTRLLP